MLRGSQGVGAGLRSALPTNEGEITDLCRYLRALTRRWPLLLVFAGLAAASGFLTSVWLGWGSAHAVTALVANALLAAALGSVVGAATALLLESGDSKAR